MELLRSLRERGDLRRDAQGRWELAAEIDWDQVPGCLQAVIKERVERLDQQLRLMLDIASVEGTEFTAEVITRILGQTENDTLRSLSQHLEKRHRLVRESGKVGGEKGFLARFTFRHILFQHYVYHHLGSAQRRGMHRNVARVLEQLYADRLDEIGTQLAYHYGQAGDGDDARRAIGYLFGAIDRTQQISGHASAQELVDQIRQLAGKHALDDPLLDIRLAYFQAKICSQSGEKVEATQLVKECLRLARDAPDETYVVKALCVLSKLLLDRTTGAEAHPFIQEILQLTDQRDESPMLAARAEGLRLMRALRWRQGDSEGAIELVRQSLVISRSTGDPVGELQSLNSLAVRLRRIGKSDQAVRSFRDALTIAQRSRRRGNEEILLSNLAFTYRDQHQLDAAERCDSDALDYALRTNSPSSVMYRRDSLPRTYRMKGDLPRAAKQFDLAIAGADRVNHALMRSDTRLNRVPRFGYVAVGNPLCR